MDITKRQQLLRRRCRRKALVGFLGVLPYRLHRIRGQRHDSGAAHSVLNGRHNIIQGVCCPLLLGLKHVAQRVSLLRAAGKRAHTHTSKTPGAWWTFIVLTRLPYCQTPAVKEGPRRYSATIGQLQGPLTSLRCAMIGFIVAWQLAPSWMLQHSGNCFRSVSTLCAASRWG